jgi:hypothetical protein
MSGMPQTLGGPVFAADLKLKNCADQDKNGATTFSITTLSIMTLSIMTLSIMTLSLMDLVAILSINDTQHNTQLNGLNVLLL